MRLFLNIAITLVAVSLFSATSPKNAFAIPTYLNNTNITVEVGPGTSDGNFHNTFNGGQTIDKVIDAPSADASEFHNQTTHIWFTSNVDGGGLELLFDFGQEYDITELHFWNYTAEGFDVDRLDFTFFNSSNVQVGELSVEPALGSSPGILAQDLPLAAPLNVQYVTAFLSGSNREVDFQNIGFTAELSEPRADDPILEATDGTFQDFVLVTWAETTTASTCEVYRSDVAGSLGDVIATVAANADYRDTTATPDAHYFYTTICNDGSRSNQDEGWRSGDEEICQDGEECLFEDLNPSACSSANGFLEQVNITSVINRSSTNLDITVEYRDQFGITQGSVETNIAPLQKKDFIINELGLQPDTYGTVCVAVDTEERGAWSGGTTLYKANTRDNDATFGSDFDFALYYPFTNPRIGAYTLPLNTFHLGVPQNAAIANWIRITDAEQGDGEMLRGTLYYYDASGKEISANYVEFPDGGRIDFSGHEGLTGLDNSDAVGMARFVPADKSDGSAAQYYISLGRYYYDCVGASCENFFTALVVPNRPATNVATLGGVSTVEGELAVVELNNNMTEGSTASVNAYQSTGVNSGSTVVGIPARGTQHTIVNRAGTQGFLAAETVGSAKVQALEGTVSAISFFYKLNDAGVLQYAYAAPLTGSPGTVQVSEFNSFINNQNTAEIYNCSEETITAQIDATDANNDNVLSTEVTLLPNETRRFTLAVPADTYGTVTIQADQKGIVYRNYVSVKGEYVLPYGAQ